MGYINRVLTDPDAIEVDFDGIPGFEDICSPMTAKKYSLKKFYSWKGAVCVDFWPASRLLGGGFIKHMVDIWFFYIQYNGFTIYIFSYLNPFSVYFNAI